MERQAKKYKKQQQEKAHLEEFIQKNIARAATSGRAKAKQKQLQKIKEVDMPFEENKSADIAFDIDKNSGNEVLEINNLAIGYSANDPIVKNINFKIRRGERAALLGPNGTGKTTLLKTAAGHLSPLKGTIETGKNVNIAYHDQELETLSQNKTIIDELWDDFPDLDYEEIRKVLGQFLFRGDAVYRLVSNLSGGEKSRLALAKLMCQKANLLILDEPTNHLDIYSNEALEDTLFNFPGTLLFVSHDRYFLDKISTKVFELTKNGIYEYQGNYSYYVEKKKAVVEEKKSNEVKEKKISKNKARYLQTKEQEKEQRRRRRRIDEIEGLIHNLEKDIIEEEKAINDPEVFTDYEALQEKSYNLNILKDKLNKYFIEWTELNEKEDSF